MTKHTSWAIALTATTFLSAPAMAASLTPTLGENSAFSYSEGSENDYNFTLQEADAEGNLTIKYYKIDLKPEAFSTSKNISWLAVGEDQKDATDVVAVQLPNDQVKYFRYTYTQPEGRTVYDTRQYTLSGDVDADFIGVYNSSPQAGNYGGALINTGIIDRVTGDFIGNNTNSNNYHINGAAIYNKNKIGSIAGDFIDNYIFSSSDRPDAQGGAIYNAGTIDNITGNFISNHLTIDSPANYLFSVQGSAIFNARSTIGNISGNFIGNYISNTINSPSNYVYYLMGGAIANYDGNSVIDRIAGNFIGNYIESTYGNVHGGALSNGYRNQIGSIKTVKIDNVIGDFIENYISSSSVLSASGGAIYNNDGMNNLTGNFINNYVVSQGYHTYGGALYNDGFINTVTGDFIGNRVLSSRGLGGAIYNYYRLGNVTGNFVGNFVETTDNVAYGGALYNEGIIESITGDFINNSVKSKLETAAGGALYSEDQRDVAGIKKISSDFVGNYAKSTDGDAYGGAVYLKNSGRTSLPNNLMYRVTVRYGDQELETYALPNSQDNMQIISAQLTLDDAEAFEQLKQQNQQEKDMMDILLSIPANELTIESYVDLMIRVGSIPEDQKDQIMAEMDKFSPEEKEQVLAEVRQEMAKEQEEIKTIQTVINNSESVNSVLVFAQRGISFMNSSFRNNKAESENGKALGGAIYGSGIEITADNYTSVFDGNTANGKNNAIYVLNKSEKVTEDLNKKLSADIQNKFSQGEVDYNAKVAAIDVKFSTVNDGIILLNDGIDGEKGYRIAFSGDKGIEEKSLRTPQYVKLNNSLANARNVYVNSTTLMLGNGTYGKGEIVSDHTALSLDNGVFDIANSYQEVVKLKGYSAANSYLHMDVDVENLSADKLMVNGNVEGQTKLVLYPTSDKDIQGESIVFAESENDTAGNKDSFKVWRVYRSPYLFEVKHTVVGENANQWELVMGEEENEYAGVEPNQPDVPDVPDVPTPELPDIPPVKPQPLPGSDRPVAPEVIGAESLPAAGLAQSSNMIYNIMQKVSSNYSHENEAFHNLWANAVYNTLRIKTPTDIDAEVWGLEAGGDLQHDLNNKLGLFLSYRKGNYDMNGDGKHHYSTVGSEIDIDSYLAGLYYRYDRNNWWTFATVYGGIQRVDLKTKDGIKSDTDGTEFGGSVELGYDYAINKTVYLTPSVGAFYTQVDYDDATDSAGKIAKYNTLRQLELEAGVKLTKAFVTDEGYANVYVKPSVVRTVADGDEVKITGLGKVNTLDDQTLGRIEIGGRYGFTEQLSTYGWANHTFGDDYKASTFGLGLSYSW